MRIFHPWAIIKRLFRAIVHLVA